MFNFCCCHSTSLFLEYSWLVLIIPVYSTSKVWIHCCLGGKVIRNWQEWSRIDKNNQECTLIYRNYQEKTKLIKNRQELSRIDTNLIYIHLRKQWLSGTRTATRSCGVWLERSWPWDGHQMDTSWTGPPLGAGEGFEALLLNFPAHSQVEM